jgi:acyl dehydratase
LKDVVEQALALVRLTQNVASVHRDITASPYPNRLVYGGHTIALAQASLSRIFRNTATVLGWHLCNHTGPVFEGDLLSFDHEILEKQKFASGNITAVRSRVFVHRNNEEPKEVLDWIPVILTS